MNSPTSLRRNDPCPCGSGRRYKRCCGGLKPDADQLFRSGVALEHAGRRSEATDCFARALQINRHHLPAATRFSAVLAGLGHREAAAQCLLNAAGERPDTVAGWLARARALSLEERSADAETALRRVLEMEPTHAEAWRTLGSVYAATGRLDAARHAVQEALRMEPKNASALADAIHLQRTTSADGPLLARIESLLLTADLPPHQRVVLEFARGKAYDKLGDPARAIAAFDAANSIKAAHVPFDRTACRRHVDQIIATFPTAEFASSERTMSGGERAILILGMPRSGTTLVEQILSSHPEVTAGGERRFWGQWGRGWMAARSAGQGDDFRARAAAAHQVDLNGVCPNAERVTDKNPFNFAWIGLIKRTLPDAFIIHCRRTPIDTCLSAYMTPFTGSTAFSASRADLVFYYRQYQRIMAHWSAVMAKRRIIDIDYETLVANPEHEIRRLVEFCELPWNDECLHPERNPRPIHTASLLRAREPINSASVARWRHYAPFLGELEALLPPSPLSECPHLR
jgi:thioredoxin-like negative regulator of GroEL